MRYHSLRFRVVPQVSTATSGGFVCAFIADVSDRIPSSEFGLSKLTSQVGAQTKKWWETASVQAKVVQELLYTSFSAEEPRLSSPGKFVLGVDGQASQKGSMTVYVDWDVSFSIPSLEGSEAEEAKIPTLQKSLWTKSGNNGVWALVTPGNYDSLSQDARKCLVDPAPNTFFSFTSPRGYVENKDNVAGQFRAFDSVWIDNSFLMWPWNSEDKQDVALSYGHTLIAAKRENVEFEAPAQVFLRGSKYLSHVPVWMQSIKGMDECQETSKICLEQQEATGRHFSELRSLSPQCSEKSLKWEILSASQEPLKV